MTGLKVSTVCDVFCRCLQNAKVALLQNDVSQCQSSGVYMSLAAHGLIAGNDIYCTVESGIDVRRQADPVIQVLIHAALIHPYSHSH